MDALTRVEGLRLLLLLLYLRISLVLLTGAGLDSHGEVPERAQELPDQKVVSKPCRYEIKQLGHVLQVKALQYVASH